MPSDWIKIYSTSQMHSAEIVVAFLEDNMIKTFKINKKDSMHIHLTNGEIELYVDPKDVIKANHLISKHKL